MTDAVKSSAGKAARKAKAEATRLRILQAAHHMLLADGYDATTMTSVAAEAGVAVQTVYFTFRTKAQLLLEVLRFAAASGPDGLPSEWKWVSEAATASDPRRTLALCAEHGIDSLARTAVLNVAVRTAAMAESDVAIQWQRICDQRRTGVTHILTALAARHPLRPGLTIEQASDILSVMPNAETFLDLTEGCGWPIEQVKAWTYRLYCEQLLGDTAPPDQRTPSPTSDLSFHSCLST